jgi:hypothetical protein
MPKASPTLARLTAICANDSSLIFMLNQNSRLVKKVSFEVDLICGPIPNKSQGFAKGEMYSGVVKSS